MRISSKFLIILFPVVFLTFFSYEIISNNSEDQSKSKLIDNDYSKISNKMNIFKDDFPPTFSDVDFATNLSELAHLQAYNYLHKAYTEEITQQDVVTHINAIMTAEGSDNVLSFPTLVISGDELIEPHGNPYDDDIHIINPITDPVVLIDLGSQCNNHSSDVTRTYFFDTATQEMKDAYDIVVETELAIIEAMAPGVTIKELNEIYNTTIEQLSFDNAWGLPYWGHGVDEWVHAFPYLGGDDVENSTLEVGQVLAVEPGYYHYDGWAVRVEDTVIITETSCEILSDSLPKNITDILIHSNTPIFNLEILIQNYKYGEEASITAYSTEFQDIKTVSYYDGYTWNSMDAVNTSAYQFSYLVNFSYSSKLISLVKVQFNDDSSFYFSQLLMLEPSIPVRYYQILPITGSSDHFENTTYGGEYNIENEEWIPGETYEWVFNSISGDTQLIRILFSLISVNSYDSFLLLDESNHLIKRYLAIENNTDIWSPWICGNTIKLSLDSQSRYGFFPFVFTIDKIELGIKETKTTGAIDFPCFFIIVLGLYSIIVLSRKNSMQ